MPFYRFIGSDRAPTVELGGQEWLPGDVYPLKGLAAKQAGVSALFEEIAVRRADADARTKAALARLGLQEAPPEPVAEPPPAERESHSHIPEPVEVAPEPAPEPDMVLESDMPPAPEKPRKRRKLRRKAEAAVTDG